MSNLLLLCKRFARRLAPWAAALACGAAPALWAQSATQELRLTVGKSVVIDYPSDIGRISTSNPDVVDAVPITAREILLNAKAFGHSTVVVWSKAGERSFFAITVETNGEPLDRILKETFPDENLTVKVAKDTASINGQVTNALVAERAAALLAPFVKSVVNNVRVVSPGVEKQILLRVRFAELNRVRAETLGVNLFSTGATNTLGVTTTGQFRAPRATEVNGVIGGQVAGTQGNFNLTDTLNLFAWRPDLNLGATIQALRVQNVLQILAEPNLVTTNGKEASFLAGGEFPIPVLQGGSNAGAVTIQFREYGIRLTFTPNTTEHNTIKMHVRSELSTIDIANAVTFQGFTIPALSTRRAETDVELGPGQSFVIGGLLDDRVRNILFRIPGLSSIPVLGQLFRSYNKEKTKTELIVLVTPEIVNPLQPGDPRPSQDMPNPGIPAALEGVVAGQKDHEEAMKGSPDKSKRN
jgi:pilus assembly protein CpaC